MAARDLIEFVDSVNLDVPFSPRPVYHPDGDFLTYYFEDADHFDQRIDSILTIYSAMADGRPVGFCIKGVKQLLKNMEGSFGILAERGKLRLNLLLFSAMSLSDNPLASGQYRTLSEPVKEVEVDLAGTA